MHDTNHLLCSFCPFYKALNKLIHLKLVRLRAWCRITWNRNILDFSTYGALQVCFLGSINVITKITYHPNSHNSPNAVILVQFAPLSGLLHCLFSLLLFSPSAIVFSQPLTSLYFLRVLCSYSLWFLLHLLWFFRYLLFFCHFIYSNLIFCL